MTEGNSCEEENNNLCGCFFCHYIRVVILISSVYQIHPFLIGNYFMCIRQMMFAMDDVGFLTQGAVSVGIIFFMAVIGYQILKRKDLF